MGTGCKLKKRELWKKYTIFASWLVLSLIVTLYSKWLMMNYFPYPITISLVHMTTVSILTYAISLSRKERYIEVIDINVGGIDKKWRNSSEEKYSSIYYEKRGILLFSLLVAVNIWLSNSSLLIASISLHQIARTTIPLFTMVLGVLFFRHTYHLVQLPPVVLVIIGVAITVNNTPELSLYGVLVVFLSCCSSSLKGIFAQKIQVDNNKKMDSIKMLTYVGPASSLTLLILSIFFGEMSKVLRLYEETMYGNIDGDGRSLSLVVLTALLTASGVLAFVLNVLSLKSSTIVTPLAMNVAGNVKQLVTCVLGCILFGNPFTDKLAIGILLTSIGAVWYSMGKKNEVNMKKNRYSKGRYIDRIGMNYKQDTILDYGGSNHVKQGKSRAAESTNNDKDVELGRDSVETECIDVGCSYENDSCINEDSFESYYYEGEDKNVSSQDENERKERNVRIVDLNQVTDHDVGDVNDNNVVQSIEVYPEIGGTQLDEMGDKTDHELFFSKISSNRIQEEKRMDLLKDQSSDLNDSSLLYINENLCKNNYNRGKI